MSHEIAVRDVKLGDYILSVTSRTNGEERLVLEELTYRTLMTWYNIVTNRLEKENYVFVGGSVEQVYADEINKQVDTDAPKADTFEFQETFGDSRVTIWDTYRGAKHPCFHLNSDDIPQVAIDVWRANQIGTERAVAKLEAAMPKKPAQPAQDAQQAAQQQFDNLPSMQPATPKSKPDATSDNKFFTKNEAIEKLAVGTVFSMKICQIKLRSKDDQKYYELYAKYGQNVGKYPEISLYTDNEVALKNGLIADLDQFGLKPGESKLGEWVLSCNVGKPKVDGDKTYGRVYADSFVK
jgi:hypothetical protein